MTSRQEKILKLIISEYVKTAIPVGSNLLAQKLACSPATVRNEMAVLEREEFIHQPHTSAGRVPSDKGYRHYVNLLHQENSLPVAEQKKLQEDFLKLQAQYKKMARVVAKLLSIHSQDVIMSSVTEEEDFATSGMPELFRHPEFSDTKEIAKIFEAVDKFDEIVDVYLEQPQEGNAVKTYIGKENLIPEVQNCSLVISEFKLPSGERGVIAVLGPKRMKYKKNISLVSYIAKFLGGGGAAMFLIIYYSPIFN
ncbi:hypothetical protein KKC60_03150 [Patescibacteria group bacterium]|nr:hypothetical protein [Patescibacteria group bacterium]